MSYIDEIIGVNLKELRIKADIDQRQLAERLNISQAMISLWESGKRSLSPSDLMEVCLILGVTPNDLYSFDSLKQKLIDKYKDSLLMLTVQDHEGIIRKGNTFTYSEIKSRKKNKPKYQIYISRGDGIMVSGINRHIIAFYTTRESMEKELKAIGDAISNGERVYRIQYGSKVTYDLTGMPVLVEEAD